MASNPSRKTRPGLTAEQVRAACGDISDSKVSAIIASGADLPALEEAVAWVHGDDETTPAQSNLAAGSAAARVSEILLADREFDED